jgi:hypothetical protein
MSPVWSASVEVPGQGAAEAPHPGHAVEGVGVGGLFGLGPGLVPLRAAAGQPGDEQPTLLGRRQIQQAGDRGEAGDESGSILLPA